MKNLLERSTLGEEITIIFPFRDSLNGRRARILEWIQREWKITLPLATQIISDSDESKPFNRSQARNRGVDQTSTPYLFMVDADSVIPSIMVYSMIDFMRNRDMCTNSWGIPYTMYSMLTEEATDVLITGPPQGAVGLSASTLPLIRPPFRSEAGAIFMCTEDYIDIGGYDEQFHQWGLEDWAFRDAALTMLGNPYRVTGNLYHLYHSDPKGEDFGSGPSLRNKKLYKPYQDALGDPQKMSKLISKSSRKIS